MLPPEWLQLFEYGRSLFEWGQGLDWSLVFEIVLLGVITTWIYTRFIRKSHAEQLLKGLSVILLLFILLYGFALLLDLKLLEMVFGFSIQILIVALIVIFQPELRRMLFYLGQPEFIGSQLFAITPPERKAEYLVTELTASARFLSKSKMGALIVLESSSDPSSNYLEAGTRLDAKLSTELLLTIFHPNTPLHDGAVIVDADNRIRSAGVLLPLTEDPKLSWQYGTRHRAAIGLTEVSSDSYCLVVSEETGSISLAIEGKLEKMATADDLKKRLEKLYNVTSTMKKKRPLHKGLSLGERFNDLFSADSVSLQFQRIFMRRGQTPESMKTKSKTPKTRTSSTGNG